MSKPLRTGFVPLFLWMGCALVLAADPPPQPSPVHPQLGSPQFPSSSPLPGAPGPGSFDSLNGGTGAAPLALPADSTGAPPVVDAANVRKFYTISAELRETYDDNVATTSNNKQSAFETTASPSILVDFPFANSELSARYTFSGTYYSETGGNTGNNRGNNNGGFNRDSYQISNEFIAQYRHDFSERLTLNLSEQFIDSTEPNLFGGTGTLYRNGENASNSFNGVVSVVWTPLLSTSTSYTNTTVRYSDSQIARDQDSIENTAAQTFSLAVLPKISATFGGIVDDITYSDTTRGYTSLTGFIGGQWQILPSLTTNGRIGGTYTETNQRLTFGGSSTTTDSVSPYGALSLNWQIGKRSGASVDYAHEVTPTDQNGANGQQSDRFTANVHYDLTNYLTSHLRGIFTHGEISNNLINVAGLRSYTEDSYALNTGLAYHFNKYFDFNLDITVSGVSSDLIGRSYNRDQYSLGVRGTY